MTSKVILVILVVVASSSCFVLDRNEDSNLDCSSEPIDLVLLLDSSSSIDQVQHGWKTVKEFAEKYLGYYDISAKGTHVTIAQWADTVKARNDFNSGQNAQTVLSEVKNMKIGYYEGIGVNTYMENALTKTRNKIFTKQAGMRNKDIKKVVVFFTDGQNNGGGDPAAAARKLKNDGVLIYTLGVSNYDRDQLRMIASRPPKNYTFYADSFDEMSAIAEDMVNKVCKRKPTPPPFPCRHPVDLALLLDTSNSIGRTNWKEVEAFAKQIVDSFEISPAKSHVAIITYRSHPTLEMKFNTYTGAELSNENIKRHIDRLHYEVDYGLEGMTYIDRALTMANEEVFTTEAGMREDGKIAKILVLLTDGMQTISRDPYTPPRRAVLPLKRKGVKVYTVGVGADLDVEGLVRTATHPSYCYSAAHFSDLEKEAKKIGVDLCPYKGW